MTEDVRPFEVAFLPAELQKLCAQAVDGGDGTDVHGGDAEGMDGGDDSDTSSTPDEVPLLD